MSKVLIGTGTTDSNGVATLDTDPNGQTISGYTGTGAGEVDLIATTTIDSSTIVSQPCPVLDCSFVNWGIGDTDDNTHWYHNMMTGSSSNYEITVDDAGKMIKNNHETDNLHYSAVPLDLTVNGNNIYKWNPSIVIEFDLVSYTGNCTVTVRNSSNNGISRTFAQLGLVGGEHITIRCDENGQYLYIDDASSPAYKDEREINDFLIRFTAQPSQSLKFKNLKVYPI